MVSDGKREIATVTLVCIGRATGEVRKPPSTLTGTTAPPQDERLGVSEPGEDGGEAPSLGATPLERRG